MSTIGIIIGWTTLVASWVVPCFIRNEKTKHFVGVILSAAATGFFLGLLF